MSEKIPVKKNKADYDEDTDNTRVVFSEATMKEDLTRTVLNEITPVFEIARTALEDEDFKKDVVELLKDKVRTFMKKKNNGSTGKPGDNEIIEAIWSGKVQ